MARSTGLVLAAGGITAANEALFAPLASGTPPWKSLNWRIIPATGLLALALAALERVVPSFAVALAGLTLASALIIPYGHAATPIANLDKIMGFTK